MLNALVALTQYIHTFVQRCCAVTLCPPPLSCKQVSSSVHKSRRRRFRASASAYNASLARTSEEGEGHQKKGNRLKVHYCSSSGHNFLPIISSKDIGEGFVSPSRERVIRKYLGTCHDFSVLSFPGKNSKESNAIIRSVFFSFTSRKALLLSSIAIGGLLAALCPGSSPEKEVPLKPPPAGPPGHGIETGGEAAPPLHILVSNGTGMTTAANPAAATAALAAVLPGANMVSTMVETSAYTLLQYTTCSHSRPPLLLLQ